MIWRFEPPLSFFDIGCTFSTVRDFLRMGRPFRALLVLPGFLFRVLVVVFANTLLYPCEVLSQLAFTGVQESEWDALESEPENGDDGRPEIYAEKADSARTGLVAPSANPASGKNGGIRHV